MLNIGETKHAILALYLFAWLGLGVSTHQAHATNLYWYGSASNSWENILNWSLSGSNPNLNPTAVAGVGDVALFNSTTPNSPQSINLNQNRFVAGLQFHRPQPTTIQSGVGSNQLSIGGGGIQISNVAGPVAITSPMQLTANQAWSNSGAFLVSGNIAGGPFTLEVSGSGDTVLAGMLQSLGGLIKTGSGTLTLDNVNTFTGDVEINGGRIAITADQNLGLGTLLLSNNGTLKLNGSILLDRDVDLNSGEGVIDAGFANSMIAGSVSGSGGLVKQGIGSLTLTGANSFDGGLAVDQGRLGIWNGSLGAGPVTVAAGAIVELLAGSTLSTSNSIEVNQGGVLTGNGTFNASAGENDTTIMGIIHPGISIGHLTFESNVELTETAEVVIEIESSVSFDTIEITGDVTLGGKLSVVVDDSIQPGDMFEVITAGNPMDTRFDDVATIGGHDIFLAPIYGGDFVALLSYNDGDLNRLGDGVTEDDVASLAMALTDPTLYRQTYGISAKEAGDVNDDGLCDVDDIPVFADMLDMNVKELRDRINLYLSVPEPASAIISILMAASILTCRRNTLVN